MFLSAQGGIWGSGVSAFPGVDYEARLEAFHLCLTHQPKPPQCLIFTPHGTLPSAFGQSPMKQGLGYTGAQRDEDPVLGSVQSSSGEQLKNNVIMSTFNVGDCSGKEEEKKSHGGGPKTRHSSAWGPAQQALEGSENQREKEQRSVGETAHVFQG